MRIGTPGRGSPVLVTGNFTLTVRRLRDALRGRDAWLLVANSKGINVWCAAGGGHLTHHDIISVIRTSRIAEQVDHREVILPQLCATGVERRRITEATGFKTRWGPARLEDLPAFLDRGARVVKSERFMRFPAVGAHRDGGDVGRHNAGHRAADHGGRFRWRRRGGGWRCDSAIGVRPVRRCLPWLNIEGHARFATFAGFAASAAVFGDALLARAGCRNAAHLTVVTSACSLAMAILSIDLAGTTPWYGSYINTFRNKAQIELVTDRCTGAAECVQVCPRDVLQMNGRRRKVEINQPDQCIQCGACIVQCPADALRFRYDDGRVVEPTTIRRTRMNLLGRRRVEIRE